MSALFTTTFARAFAQAPCPAGYRRAVKALGGMKKHGRNTETSIQELIGVLTWSDLDWMFSNGAEVFDGPQFLFVKIIKDAARLAYLARPIDEAYKDDRISAMAGFENDDPFSSFHYGRRVLAYTNEVARNKILLMLFNLAEDAHARGWQKADAEWRHSLKRRGA